MAQPQTISSGRTPAPGPRSRGRSHRPRGLRRRARGASACRPRAPGRSLPSRDLPGRPDQAGPAAHRVDRRHVLAACPAGRGPDLPDASTTPDPPARRGRDLARRVLGRALPGRQDAGEPPSRHRRGAAPARASAPSAAHACEVRDMPDPLVEAPLPHLGARAEEALVRGEPVVPGPRSPFRIPDSTDRRPVRQLAPPLSVRARADGPGDQAGRGHRLVEHPDRAGICSDAPHGPGDPPGRRSTRPLRRSAGGPLREPLQASQVPHDARRGPRRASGALGGELDEGPGVQARARSTRHAAWPLPAPLQPRRAPAALRRAGGPDEPDRTATGRPRRGGTLRTATPDPL